MGVSSDSRLILTHGFVKKGDKPPKDEIDRAETIKAVYRGIAVGAAIECNLTQAQVAKKVGTTASAIRRYESAEYDRYELQTLRKIGEACRGKIDIVVAPTAKGKAAW